MEGMMDWIDVKERLPEEDGQYLVYGIGLASRADHYANGQWWKQHGWQPDELKRKVTHWMPLPQPPDKGEK